VKYAIRVLKSSVTVKDGVGIRVIRDCPVKSVIYQRIVIAVADHIGDDATVVQIENGAQVDLSLLAVLIPFELGYIRQPFLVGLLCVKFAVEDILCQILWIGGVSRAAVVCILDGGLNIPAAADPQRLLVADPDAVKPI